MHYLYNYSCKSYCWFFCICNNCVEPFLELSSRLSASEHLVRRWFSAFRRRAIFFWLQNQLIWALFWVSVNERWHASWVIKVQKNMGFCINVDKFYTKIGIFFPIHVLVLFSLQSSNSLQIDGKSKRGYVFRKFWVLCIRDAKLVKFVDLCFMEMIHVVDNVCLNQFLQIVKGLVRWPHLSKWFFTQRKTAGFEKRIDLGDIASVTVVAW